MKFSETVQSIREKMVKPIHLLILLGFMWGSAFSLARYAITHGVSSLAYSFWQAFGPAVVLMLVVIIRRFKFCFSWEYMRCYLVAGIFGVVLPNTSKYIVTPHLPSGILAVMINTVPLFIYPLALLTQQEKFCFKRLSGVCLGLIGIVGITLARTKVEFGYVNGWMLMALVTPCCYALCIVFIIKYRPKDCHSVVLSAGMLIIASLLLLPVIFKTGQFHALTLPIHRVDVVILLEVLISSVGYILLFELVKIIGPVFYSFIDGVVAITGLFWGWVIFKEHLNFLSWMAILLILMGICLVISRSNSVAEIIDNPSEQPEDLIA